MEYVERSILFPRLRLIDQGVDGEGDISLEDRTLNGS